MAISNISMPDIFYTFQNSADKEKITYKIGLIWNKLALFGTNRPYLEQSSVNYSNCYTEI